MKDLFLSDKEEFLLMTVDKGCSRHQPDKPTDDESTNRKVYCMYPPTQTGYLQCTLNLSCSNCHGILQTTGYTASTPLQFCHFILHDAGYTVCTLLRHCHFYHAILYTAVYPAVYIVQGTLHGCSVQAVCYSVLAVC